MPKFVDPEEVRRTFDYDPKTGRLIRKIGGRGGAKVGDIAGYVEELGHRRTWFKNRLELTARMVWAWHHGASPEKPIVHVNGDKSDDRIENLMQRQDLTAKRRVIVSQPELQRLFRYEDGELIRMVTTAHNAEEGRVAGSVRPDGYSAINVGGRLHLKHRLIWMYHFGKWPDGEIDHINRDRTDSRIENLRDVPKATNISNGPARAAGGFKGVSRIGNKYFSRISIGVGEKPKYLGTYETPEQAHEAFKRAHAERYGACSEYFEGIASGEPFTRTTDPLANS